MKKLIVYVLIAGCSLLGFGQEVLVIPYDANSLTDEQRNSNPDYLIYPASLKDSVSSIMMVCEENEFAFSVSATDKVMFSPGNLQYHPANDEWRFAPNQWDYIGEENSNISSTYNGWLDLFGWSSDNPTTPFGVSTSVDDNDYGGTLVDWGINEIGTYAPNTWRTLSENEWRYLSFDRPNASNLKGAACVNGVKGAVLLPDDWSCPADVTFISGAATNYITDCTQLQSFTIEQWLKLEQSGAIFFPDAGEREGIDVSGVQETGNYWTSTGGGAANSYGNMGAVRLLTTSGSFGFNGAMCDRGLSVRLVTNL